jgi:hypothetical protein
MYQEQKTSNANLYSRGTTHKNSVIQFCSQKIKHAHELYSDSLDKESYILVWQLLILLLRQNGVNI